jgi:hypothetical protein
MPLCRIHLPVVCVWPDTQCPTPRRSLPVQIVAIVRLFALDDQHALDISGFRRALSCKKNARHLHGALVVTSSFRPHCFSVFVYLKKAPLTWDGVILIFFFGRCHVSGDRAVCLRPWTTNVWGLNLPIHGVLIRVVTHPDLCWRILSCVDKYWRMLTYTDVCWRILKSADVCWRMLTCTDLCWRMLACVGVLRSCTDFAHASLCSRKVCIMRPASSSRSSCY